MLIVLCTVEVIAPSLPLRIVTTPLCLLIACNILAHYYWACTIPPGFADEHMRLSGTRSRPEAAWRTYLIAPERSHQADNGTQWTQNDLLEGSPSTCGKCGNIKPEVRGFMHVEWDTAKDAFLCKRTHHCRICKRCVLKYDHHCPVRIPVVTPSPAYAFGSQCKHDFKCRWRSPLIPKAMKRDKSMRRYQ